MVYVDLKVFRYLHLQVTLQVGAVYMMLFHLCKTPCNVHIKARYINKKGYKSPCNSVPFFVCIMIPAF